MSGIEALGQSTFTQSTAATKSKELGRDDFLTMFVAQLKNQDPLNPMQGSDFAAQLAQFSSLEQLYNVNENIKTLQSSEQEASKLQALDFIGKEIAAKGDSLQLVEGKVATGSFALNEQAECTVSVKDEKGNVVRAFSLGLLSAGAHSFQWDGHDGSGNLLSPGTYHFSVSAKNTNGQIVSGDPRVTGKVTEVNLENDAARLFIGDVPVSLSDVTGIADPPAAETSGNQ